MPEEAQDFTQKAIDLRKAGRLEEAILAARKAVSLNAESANAWWQLALAQDEKDGLLAARAALNHVTALSPGFVPAWCELARASQKAGELDLAVEQFECALGADAEDLRSLLFFDALLRARKGPGDDKRRLRVLRQLDLQGNMPPDRRFDFAFLLADAGEKLDAIHVYESSLRDHQTEASFYNVALLYRSVGRHADALDAFTMAAEKAPEDSANKVAVEKSLKQLEALRAKVLRSPEPYLSPQDWYQHYVSPFMLLNGGDPMDLRLNPKALQKAKHALYREIELEDGRVEWIPGLTIDKSAAMAKLELLNSHDQWSADETPYYNDPLRDFLERGHFAHFLPAPGDTEGTRAIAKLASVETLAILGPSFAAQFDLVLTKAVTKGDIDAIECLLGGRRWVLPEHEEQCFAGAKRAIERLLEPIAALRQQAADRTVRRAEIRAALDAVKLEAIITQLPAEFHAIHSEFAELLRGFSVALFNRERDAEEAMAILRWGRQCTAHSPAIAHQIEEDEEFLRATIAKERESETHLKFKNKDFSITKDGITYGNEKIPLQDCVAARWGTVQTDVSPVTLRFRLAFKGRSGDAIDVNWTTASDLETQKKLFGEATNAVVQYVLDPVITNFRKSIASGWIEKVGPLKVRISGVTFHVEGWFSNKDVEAAWRNLRSEIANGAVTIWDATNSKCRAILPVEQTDNALVLHLMCNQ